MIGIVLWGNAAPAGPTTIISGRGAEGAETELVPLFRLRVLCASA
jgi:hypothetical protein